MEVRPNNDKMTINEILNAVEHESDEHKEQFECWLKGWETEELDDVESAEDCKEAQKEFYVDYPQFTPYDELSDDIKREQYAESLVDEDTTRGEFKAAMATYDYNQR